MGKSLKNELSISELRTMRDDGMSNSSIAKRLDISVSTVSRYLGPMTHEERCRVMRDRDYDTSVTPAKKPANILSRPVMNPFPVAAMVYEIKGDIATYSVDAVEGDISFNLNGNTVKVKANEVETLARELNRVLDTVRQVDFAMVAMGGRG